MDGLSKAASFFSHFLNGGFMSYPTDPLSRLHHRPLSRHSETSPPHACSLPPENDPIYAEHQKLSLQDTKKELLGSLVYKDLKRKKEMEQSLSESSEKTLQSPEKKRKIDRPSSLVYRDLKKGAEIVEISDQELDQWLERTWFEKASHSTHNPEIYLANAQVQIEHLIALKQEVTEFQIEEKNCENSILTIEDQITAGEMNPDTASEPLVCRGAMMGSMIDKIEEREKQFKKLMDKLNPYVKEELNLIMKNTESNIFAALVCFNEALTRFLIDYEQVQGDIFRENLTIRKQDGKEILVSQSFWNLKPWAEITGFQEDLRSLEYSYNQITQNPQFSSLEANKELVISKATMNSLDDYLKHIGYGIDKRQNIYADLQQGILSTITPECISPELMEIANNPRLSNEKRAYAYNLAFWKVGLPFGPPIDLESKMNTNGFADYHSDNLPSPVEVKKVQIRTLDLKEHQIYGHYMIQFKNPITCKTETYYYLIIRSLSRDNYVIKKMNPNQFPNLAEVIQLPKFPLASIESISS